MYKIAQEVQVLLRDSNDGLHPATLSALAGSDHTLTGWYDSFGHSAGGLVRIIVAS